MAKTYAAMVEMVSSISLKNRLVACAAEQEVENPAAWVEEHIWKIANTPNWAADWQYASDISGSNPNVNPDLGERTDVIDDAKMLAGVAAIIAEEQPA